MDFEKEDAEEKQSLSIIRLQVDLWRYSIARGDQSDEIIGRHEKEIEADLQTDFYWGPFANVLFNKADKTAVAVHTDGRRIEL